TGITLLVQVRDQLRIQPSRRSNTQSRRDSTDQNQPGHAACTRVVADQLSHPDGSPSDEQLLPAPSGPTDQAEHLPTPRLTDRVQCLVTEVRDRLDVAGGHGSSYRILILSIGMHAEARRDNCPTTRRALRSTTRQPP